MNLLTLSSARSALWDYGNSQVPLVSASVAQIADFNARLNQVVERYLSDMKPALLYRRVQVPIYNHTVTLPRGLQSLLGIMPVNQNNCACSPLAIYTRFHEFAQLGAASMCGAGCNGGAFPVSETVQSFREPESTFRLKVTSTANGGTISFIGGYDTDWNEYFDSVSVSIIDGGSDITTREWPAGSMPRISKSATTAGVLLYSVDADDEETLIAVYAPSETDPAYQRFQLPCYPDNIQVARILSRLTFVEMSDDKDIVIPSRLGVLKLGLMALNYEDRNDFERADGYWSRGLKMIDNDKQEFEGDAAIPLVDAVPGFGCSDVPNIV
jgi:hypothetical protein